jgi:hypothetical protein
VPAEAGRVLAQTRPSVPSVSGRIRVARRRLSAKQQSANATPRHCYRVRAPAPARPSAPGAPLVHSPKLSGAAPPSRASRRDDRNRGEAVARRATGLTSLSSPLQSWAVRRGQERMRSSQRRAFRVAGIKRRGRVPCHRSGAGIRDVRSSASSAGHGTLLDHASSGHAGAATAPREEGQSERDCRVGDEAEAVGRLSRSRWTLGFTRNQQRVTLPLWAATGTTSRLGRTSCCCCLSGREQHNEPRNGLRMGPVANCLFDIDTLLGQMESCFVP